MHHVGTITKTNNKALPFHAQCVCGTAGDFAPVESARAFLAYHFSKLTGVNTTELVDNSDKPPAPDAPAYPLTHAASAPIPDAASGQAGEPVDPSAQIPATQSEAPAWPKKKKK